MTTRFKVSPVFGVIIMVIITVIFAGAVAWFIFGMSGNIEKTQEINGFVLKKTITDQGMEINIVDETNQRTALLTVTDSPLFNKLEAFKRYTFTVTSKDKVLSVTGPL